jgi:cytoskeletal protein RodZ
MLLIGVLFGGFYAYQHRKNNSATDASNSVEPPVANPAKVEASPTTEHGATEPASGTVSEEKKQTNPTVVADAVKKNEKAPKKKTDKTSGDADVDVSDIGQDPNFKVVPETPERPPIFMSPTDIERLKRLGGTTTRNLRNGTQVTVLQDGTRVVTMPDGTKQVIPPGLRVFRRRAPRKQ